MSRLARSHSEWPLGLGVGVVSGLLVFWSSGDRSGGSRRRVVATGIRCSDHEAASPRVLSLPLSRARWAFWIAAAALLAAVYALRARCVDRWHAGVARRRACAARGSPSVTRRG